MRNLIIMFALLFIATQALAVDVAQPAPDFTLKRFNGENLRLEEYRGKVVFINFWASWCGPCRQEMPILDQIRQRYAPLGLVVLGVNVDSNFRKAKDIADETHVKFPLLRDSHQHVSEAYQVAGMPFTVIVDRDGVVRYVHRGYKPGDEREYVDRIRHLLAHTVASE